MMRARIEAGLEKAAEADNFHDGANQLLKTLGYESGRRGLTTFKPKKFVEEFPNPRGAGTQTELRFLKEVQSTRILFQMTDDEVNQAAQRRTGEMTLFESGGSEMDESVDRSFFFASVELNGESYSRGKYAEFTRELNKRLPIATVALFRTQSRRISIALADRREHKAEKGRAVLGRVSLLREIDPGNMRSDANILEDLTLNNRIEWMQDLAKNAEKRNFDGLRKAWLDTLDTESLNKRFYKELKAWFDRVVEEATFPTTKTQTQQDHAIRLITRMLFIWFMKEKGLVNKNLFNPKQVAPLLRNWNIVSGDSYYRAVLQNLFFATLNTPIDLRDFSRLDNSTRHIPNPYRYADLMTDPVELRDLFKKTPFINGGLFECLDDLEGVNPGGKQVDCFTDDTDQRKEMSVPDDTDQRKEMSVPNSLFFDKKNGLFNLFKGYKFTVEENTPIEQEVALDPELLGNVFENLLAEMNPETRDTARKMTGSYYTPRDVVNYMTKEALAAALAQKVQSDPKNADDWDENLNVLLDDEKAWDEAGDLFSDGEKRRLTEGIADLKILDPAVGSGAFPMAALLKLTMALRRIDPKNELWEDVLLKRARDQAEKVIGQEQDNERYHKQMGEIKKTFDRLRDSDYGRKLFLIQNNIFGVDIQRIACQIAKLRFFITLAIEQESNKDEDNYGIKPLPNLETRFVAADALLSLHPKSDKPQKLRSELTDQLKQEIHENRRRYFLANEHDEKNILKGENEILRGKLSKQLKTMKWTDIAAERIANWDSFSQTDDPADWFDPEYMFGVRYGFDVVIGNPPYVQLQKNGGELGEKYQNTGKDRKTRFETFARTGDIYCLFYEQALNLAAEGGCACLITSNKWMRSDYGKKLRDLFVEKISPALLIDMGPGVFEASVDTNILLLRKAAPLPNAVINSVEMKPDFSRQQGGVGEYVRKNGVEMPVPDAGYPWTIASAVELNILKKMRDVGTPLKEWDVNINRGVTIGCNDAFIIDADTRSRLAFEDPRSDEILKQILRGRDIQRWVPEWAGLWLIDSHNGFGDTPPIDMDDYPAVKAWLDHFYPRLEKRQDKGKTPYNLRSCAYHEAFSEEKLMWKDIATSGYFTYVNVPMFCNNTSYIMTGTSLKYLCAVLNSRLVTWFMRKAAAGLGQKAIRWIATYVNRLPIPRPPTPEVESALVLLVDAILSKKASDPGADVSRLEEKIDGMVYDLYGLTEEERAAVSGG